MASGPTPKPGSVSWFRAHTTYLCVSHGFGGGTTHLMMTHGFGGGTTHLMMTHGFGGGIVRRALVVVAHMGVAGVQQLAQPKVCR